MIEQLQQLNYILAVAGLISVVITTLIVVDMKTKQYLTLYVERFGLLVASLATLSGTILTLIYSEYFGIMPCGLCWLERVALYPQVFILGVALYYKDFFVARYGIALSIFGLIVSLYHHYIQMGGSEFVKCPTSGADCAKRFLFEFDFVTFPLLAVFLFAFLIALYLYILKVTPQST